MTVIDRPICVDCKRLHAPMYGKWGLFCDAFPDGIPETIIHSEVDHHEPVEGDHGLQFLAKSDAARHDADQIIAQAQQFRERQD